VTSALKRLLLATLTAKPFSGIWAPFKRGRGTIFMLHRFTDHDLGSTGHDPSLLRSALAYLRRERYELVSLTELFRRLGEGASRVDRAVAFTMDDGYLDQATVAGQIFADFDCPATTFVTTGSRRHALVLVGPHRIRTSAHRARGARRRVGLINLALLP